jgi:hypothetical protein
MVVRNVKTRWNSVLAMLDRAFMLRKVFPSPHHFSSD